MAFLSHTRAENDVCPSTFSQTARLVVQFPFKYSPEELSSRLRLFPFVSALHPLWSCATGNPVSTSSRLLNDHLRQSGYRCSSHGVAFCYLSDETASPRWLAAHSTLLRSVYSKNLHECDCRLVVPRVEAQLFSIGDKSTVNIRPTTLMAPATTKASW